MDIVERMRRANERADQLKQRKARIDARREEARRTFRLLRDEAVEKFKTADPDELQAQVEQADRENLSRIEAYERALTEQERAIAEAEKVLRLHDEAAGFDASDSSDHGEFR